MLGFGDKPQAAGGSGGLVKESTDAKFMADVIEASKEVPVIVDFWAPWCGPCRMMAPEFSKAASALSGKARLVKVNTEAEPRAGQIYGIRGIPTMVKFKGGREVKRQSGAVGAAAIMAWAQV